MNNKKNKMINKYYISSSKSITIIIHFAGGKRKAVWLFLSLVPCCGTVAMIGKKRDFRVT